MIISIWIFYDETNLAEVYNIKKEGYQYYFLWTLVLIPFQTCIDIFFYNILEQYHGINFSNYLQRQLDRFQRRKNNWKACDTDKNLALGKSTQEIDKFCYSSQYYFASSLALSGLCFNILGIQTMLSVNYNMFADNYLIIIIPFW